VIQLSALSKAFADRVLLDTVTWQIDDGERAGLSGPNGSGKTTLLRTIAGMLAPLSGRVERRPGRIAYLPQNPGALLHRPTVRAEVELTLRRSEDGRDPEPILHELGLAQVADRYPRDLSSGERQRAALAAVLAGRPACVLLDEPTRGMDASARDALVRVICRLRDQGSAVVLATHDNELRDLVAGRIVTVRDGKVAA
jgi:ABC-type multidrug transport system ATPase subunit